MLVTIDCPRKSTSMLNLSHKNLEVYHISMLLVKEVYLLTNDFPKQELYSLVSQIRRAAISVCSNIAEGASRTSPKEKKRFYEVVRGSIVEIDTQLEIAISLNYYSKNSDHPVEKYMVSIFRILSKMISNFNVSRTSS